jgi:hypothetical protein
MYRTALADRAIDGTDDRIGVTGDRSHARPQRAREKIIETAVRQWISLHRFSHVDLVAAQKIANEQTLDRRRFDTHDSMDHPRQSVFGQYVLQASKQPITEADVRNDFGHEFLRVYFAVTMRR